jgi:hypothetical protein
MQIVAKEWDYVDPAGEKTTLADYMREIGKVRSQTHHINLCVKKLEKYRDGDISIQAADEKWLFNFQTHLLKECGINVTTAAEYYQAVRLALNQASRDRLIQSNLAGNMKSLEVPESKKVFLSIEKEERLFKTPVKGEIGARSGGYFCSRVSADCGFPISSRLYGKI